MNLGVLQSSIHVKWSLRAGGWLGVGNDPVYTKSRCFDTFPFPDATERQRAEIRSLSEELDLTRKSVLAENSDLTLTNVYNVIEKLKSAATLNKVEEDIKARGRAVIIKDLHDRIDDAVFRAYRLETNLSDNQILEQLISLNEQRVAEERRGLIRWLRPAYQVERLGPLAHRADRIQSISAHTRPLSKQPFPSEPKEQAARVLRLLRVSRTPLAASDIALSFTEGNRVLPDVEDILKSLARLGDAKSFDSGRTYSSAAA